MMLEAWVWPAQEAAESLSVEALLLLVLVIGGCVAIPLGLRFMRSQKRLVEAAAKRQAAFEAEAEQRAVERAERLTLDAAQKLEEQLGATINRMHERIMKLEGDVSERDKRIDAMQEEMGKLHEQGDRMQSEIKALRRRNAELATMLRRAISQLERHEIKPDIDREQFNQAMAEEEAKA